MYIQVKNDNDASKLSNLLKSGNWMVLYYAEWCGHCKAMKPEWQKAVESMTTKNQAKQIQNINIADVISDQIPQLTHKPDIKGFPTINIYVNGKPKATFSDSSPRDAKNIRQFAMDNAERGIAPIHMPDPAFVFPPAGLLPQIPQNKSSKKSTKSKKNSKKSKKTSKKSKKSKKNSKKSKKTSKKSSKTAFNKRISAELPMIDLVNSAPPSVQVDNAPAMSLEPESEPNPTPGMVNCESLATREDCKTNSQNCYYDFKEFKCKRKTGKKQQKLSPTQEAILL
jgi:thiol-disulfide isomerase/thioredoxin